MSKEEEQTEESEDQKEQETTALAEKASLPQTKEERDEALAEVWGNTKLIRKYFAPNLNKAQFALFIGQGKMLGANPFTKEIEPAVIKGNLKLLVKRDFYRRKAQEQDTYNGHRVVAVYSEDDFTMENGKPQHNPDSFADRGELVGAYAIGWRKDVDHAFVEKVRLDEYDRGNYIWNNKKETMIKKVAEAHLLRAMYQGILSNTYIPEEIPEPNNPNQTTDNGKTRTENIIIEAEEQEN